MKSILFIVESAPYLPSTSSDEAHDLIMASTAYGHGASVLFVDDGVAQVQQSQSPPDGFKNTAKRIRGFDMFDVGPLYVCEDSLKRNNITAQELISNIVVVSSMQKKTLLEQADFIIKV